MMKIEDIKIIETPLVLASPAEVDALAARLWVTLPSGYREYVTQLGEGILGGSLVRIYPPWRVEKELSEWRRRIDKYWFWDAGREKLPKERALECIVIADTLNGDELVFHPSRPDRLFVLPRQSEQIFEVGGDLLSAIEWMCSSGELTEPFSEREFEPFDSRIETVEENEPASATDPEGESLQDIINIAQQWAKRHDVRKIARKNIRENAPKGAKTEPVYEGIIIDAPSPLEIGYRAEYHIIGKDKKTLGVSRWFTNAQMPDGFGGYSYEPAKSNDE
ncbi:MAG: SMI1/KNR4 family protein [Pseudomonadales bacterium]|jgi:hypothetical protein|nr:SMI1/KNR4 family protein [Pseudomonadales bacterium]